jgi:hypothetical protein
MTRPTEPPVRLDGRRGLAVRAGHTTDPVSCTNASQSFGQMFADIVPLVRRIVVPMTRCLRRCRVRATATLWLPRYASPSRTFPGHYLVESSRSNSEKN